MNKAEALSILEIVSLSGANTTYTAEDVKNQYRKMISKYHPDRNPLGLHMTQLINEAYEMLQDTSGELDDEVESFAEGVLNALRAVMDLGLNVEMCGTWVWVSGDTRPHKELLKSHGYRWSGKKMMWYWHEAQQRSYGRGKYSIEEIRGKYGSRGVRVEGMRRVQAS